MMEIENEILPGAVSDEMSGWTDTVQSNWVTLQEPLMFILVEISNPRVMFLCTDCITVFADFKTVCKNSHACLSAHKIRLNSKTSCSENQDCTLYGLSNLRTATCNSEILDALRRPSACIKYPILPRLILDKPNEVKVLSGAVRDACRCCGICGLVFRSRKQTLDDS